MSDLLTGAGVTYAILRQFPAALKLYDRALDITPDDPDVKAEKAGIYQAQGNLQEAASSLSQINEQTPSVVASGTTSQLRLDRNYGESIRLLQARHAQSMILSSKRALIRCCLLLRNVLPAIPQEQKLPLNRRAIHSRSSTEINQTTPTLRQRCLKLMLRRGTRTRP